MEVVKNIALYLSENRWLNERANETNPLPMLDRWIAGTTVEEMVEVAKRLNAKSMAVSVDHVGDFVYTVEKATRAKDALLETIEAIRANELRAELSVRLPQLGLRIDEALCARLLEEIVQRAAEADVFVTINVGPYDDVQATYRLFDTLRESYDSIGTVVQTSFYRSAEDVLKYRDETIRLTKGAYEESPAVAYQTEEETTDHFKILIKERLESGAFTSIATHDDALIEWLMEYVEENDIPFDTFEIQLLYGEQCDVRKRLVRAGYPVRIYLPFGEEWYNFSMRRLAERAPALEEQVTKVVNPKTVGITSAAIGLGALTYYMLRKRKSKEDDR